MNLQTSRIQWTGSSKEGYGKLIGDSGFPAQTIFAHAARRDESVELTPEKLLMTALGASYANALARSLEEVGASPRQMDIRASMIVANAHLPNSNEILLQIVGDVPHIDESTFIRLARKAKGDCAICRALAGMDIRLEAILSSSPPVGVDRI